MNLPKCLLVYPPSDIKDNSVPPLGLMSISAYVDAVAPQEHLSQVLNLVAYDLRTARRLIIDNMADVSVVGITLMSTDILGAKWVAGVVHEINPQAVVVAGGPHATLAPETFLSPGNDFDIAVSGEGEYPFFQLLALYASGGRVEVLRRADEVPGVSYVRNRGLVPHVKAVSTPVEDWKSTLGVTVTGSSEEPLVFTSADGLRRRAVSLVTSRSCPLNCNFCSIISMNTSYRTISVEVGIEWLRQEMNRSPFEHIYFLDADFLVSKSRARHWSQAIHANFPDVTWSVQVNVGHVLALGESLKELRSRGLVAAELGLEAGNDRQLSIFNKTNFGKLATVDQSKVAVKLLRDADIQVGVDYIMFYPDLTLRELAQNLSFISEAGLIDSYDTGHYNNELLLFPGTVMREVYQKESEMQFSVDELPDARKHYKDFRVASIRDEFFEGYSAHVLKQTGAIRRKLRHEAKSCAYADRRACLRLLEIALRHQPYHVLKEMIRHPDEAAAVVLAAEKQNDFVLSAMCSLTEVKA